MMVYKNEIYVNLHNYDGFTFWIHLRISKDYDKNINKNLYEFLSKIYGIPLVLGIYDITIELHPDEVRKFEYDFLYYEHNSMEHNTVLSLEYLEFITKSLLESYDSNELDEKYMILLYKLELKVFETENDEEIFDTGYKLLRNINHPDCIQIFYV